MPGVTRERLELRLDGNTLVIEGAIGIAPQEQMTALLAKTTNASVAGQYEKYKTSTMFDGTVHNPQYLG